MCLFRPRWYICIEFRFTFSRREAFHRVPRGWRFHDEIAFLEMSFLKPTAKVRYIGGDWSSNPITSRST